VAAAWRPDLVLLDVAGPHLDSATALARWCTDKRTSPIPVVVLTADARTREWQRFKALGAIGTIAKPLDAASFPDQVRHFIAVEGVLASAREGFFRRLQADACALAACRRSPERNYSKTALARIDQIAHSLAGAGGIYGFAGISCESAALSDAAQNCLVGRAKPVELEIALDRVLERIAPR